jgi:chaperonin GroEL
VTVEEAQSMGVSAEFVEGLQFDRGFVSSYMITDLDRMEAEYKDPYILLTDKKISSVKEILPLLEKIAGSGRKDLVIVCDDVDGEALTTFVVNKIRGSFNVLAIKAPGYGDRKKDILADIATTIGAKVFSDETGLTFEKAELNMLGRASRVVADKDNTTIVGGKGKKADIDARVNQLKTQLKKTDSKFDKEKIEERIAKLSGGVAVIKVGAVTETEMKYLKLKIEDAVNATKSAIEEGIVIGGGDKTVKFLKYKNRLSSEIKNLDVEGIFIEIGQIPNTDLLKNIVNIDSFGKIEIDFKNNQTSQKGIWAAGDCTNILYHQNNIAAGEGVKALEDIYQYIKRNS